MESFVQLWEAEAGLRGCANRGFDQASCCKKNQKMFLFCLVLTRSEQRGGRKKIQKIIFVYLLFAQEKQWWEEWKFEVEDLTGDIGSLCQGFQPYLWVSKQSTPPVLQQHVNVPVGLSFGRGPGVRCYDQNFRRFCQLSAKKRHVSQKPMLWSFFCKNTPIFSQIFGRKYF
jgi:hypothetical protein